MKLLVTALRFTELQFQWVSIYNALAKNTKILISWFSNSLSIIPLYPESSTHLTYSATLVAAIIKSIDKIDTAVVEIGRVARILIYNSADWNKETVRLSLVASYLWYSTGIPNSLHAIVSP